MKKDFQAVIVDDDTEARDKAFLFYNKKILMQTF